MIKKRGLRFKLASFIIALVLLIIIIISAPIYLLTTGVHREILLRPVILAVLAAAFIGITGALLLSALITRPIHTLLSHIEIIRDTDDMAKLEGHNIHIPYGDEISILGGAINDMTYGLVKAAAAAADLSIGKEIQKKLIPLDLDKHGNKKTFGSKHTAHVDFFGFYEGAKGVSGDYFDYKDLDGRYYAIIKCDVAGKGIPAALIMIQVATMFLNHFKKWKPDVKGMRIDEAVYHINEFIETLAFKGRFAAFTLCLYDSITGTARVCSAGDNIIHIYDASEGKIKSIVLPETPAAGVLPNNIIKSSGGYKVQTITIDRGDILLLYTDGIEEMGKELVHDIINAAMARQTYTLDKHHNPKDNKALQFDFSSCQGRVEDTIMAMVSVEKIFRCYKDPKAGDNSRVLVDRKIDEFLKKHFLQYGHYCSHTRDFPENDAY
ncbi:MAG: SpoIIE family protein phosphatase, partial [Treponema sp.]|nr:SpoIIE family protein phosphatase [Treponema sp.]